MKNLFATLALLFCLSAFGADLTSAQRATVKADISATPEAAVMLQIGNLSGIAAFYNTEASPPFVVWKTEVSVDQIMRNGLDWTRVDNLTVGKARIWDWMTRLGMFDASKANIRAGIDATWVGTSADLAVRATVYSHCKRNATRLEKLLATGVGTDASPATMTFVGEVDYSNFIGM